MATKTTKPRKATAKATGKPKRGLTAYILFTKDMRPQVMREYPDASFTEIPKIMSAKWASVTPAMKKKYEDMAAKDKVRYQREMANYVPDPTTEKKKKRVRDPDAPKKALSAYNIYVKTAMAKNRPQGSMTSVVSTLASEWKRMGERERQPFVAAAAKDKQRYEREKAK